MNYKTLKSRWYLILKYYYVVKSKHLLQNIYKAKFFIRTKQNCLKSYLYTSSKITIYI